METIDKIFEKKERDYSYMRDFLLKKIDFICFIWQVIGKINKNYNKGKFGFWWGILKNKNYFKTFNRAN